MACVPFGSVPCFFLRLWCYVGDLISTFMLFHSLWFVIHCHQWYIEKSKYIQPNFHSKKNLIRFSIQFLSGLRTPILNEHWNLKMKQYPSNHWLKSKILFVFCILATLLGLRCREKEKWKFDTWDRKWPVINHCLALRAMSSTKLHMNSTRNEKFNKLSSQENSADKLSPKSIWH